MKLLRSLEILVLVGFALSGLAGGQKWQAVKQKGGFQSGYGVMLLLTDGTVLVQDDETPNWFKLTPDNTGSYINGTWKKVASTESTYGPLWFGSIVLSDGRVVIEGGSITCLGARFGPTKERFMIQSRTSGPQ